MVQIKDITNMCKAGKTAEAYNIVKQELTTSPQDVWVQRAMGWTLYFMVKNDVATRQAESFFAHLEELTQLESLTMQNDKLIFDNILWSIVTFMKTVRKGDSVTLTRIFTFLKHYTFLPSPGYSALLRAFKQYEYWKHEKDFFEWWNLDNLMPDDYHPFVNTKGQKIMSLAEQVYIAYAKVLLRCNNRDAISTFLPQLEKLATDYSDMTYPGYFCGKLLLALGGNRDEELKMLVPFARRKQREFWIWQLLSEVYHDQPDMYRACLLRAVHCKTQETFLTKIRSLLAKYYMEIKDYPRARFHLDKIVECCRKEKRDPSFDVQCMMNDPQITNAKPDNSETLDYKEKTDAILYYDANSSTAIVTYINTEFQYLLFIYGKELTAKVRLKTIKGDVHIGSLLTVKWQKDLKGETRFYKTEPTTLSALTDECNSYIRKVQGTVTKRADKQFAFVKSKDSSYFVTPNCVSKYNLTNGISVTAIAAYYYNKSKNVWNWQVIAICD